MTSKDLKDLFESGKYQEVLDYLAQKEEQGEITFLSEDERITCRYYQSRSLECLGRLEEALQVTTADRADLVTPQDKSLPLALLVAQLYALFRLGQLDEALVTSKQGKTIIAELTTDERSTGASWIASFEHIMGNIYSQKDELDTALEYYERSLTVREMLDNPQDLADSLKNIGIIYYQKGEMDTALEYYEQGLALFETIGNSQGIGHSLNNIGNVHLQKGELDTALEYHERSLAIYETIGNPQDIAHSLNNIGEIYRTKGELDTALEYHERSLAIREMLGNPQDIAASLNNIGEINHRKGELDTARNYLQRSVDLFETIGNDIYTTEPLFYLILLTLDQQEQPQAQTYLDQLQQLQARTPNKKIHLLSRLAEALVLKQSPRMTQKSQAQMILEEITNEDIIDFERTALALVHLCDLLLFELKTSGQPEVLQEVNALTQRLLESAKQQHSYWLLTETYVLQSRLALLDLDFQRGQRLLDQAQLLAEEKGLQRLAIKISSEQDQFQVQLAQWEQLLARQAPLKERLELAQLETQLMRMVQKQVKISEKEALAYSRKTKPFKAYDGPDPFIFVSYAHADKKLVYPEIQRLHQEGYRIWYDEGISPGVSWREEVAKALDGCAFFVVFLSPHAVLSRYVPKEIFYVLDDAKPFLSVYLKPTELTRELKLELGPIQALMKFDLSDQEYYSKLTTMLPSTLKDTRESGILEE
ncbi:MAG: tetratricopeptide repeat protein [Candidatus Hermodarchaeota archaeon]